jgi:hypothetical protein
VASSVTAAPVVTSAGAAICARGACQAAGAVMVSLLCPPTSSVTVRVNCSSARIAGAVKLGRAESAPASATSQAPSRLVQASSCHR